MTEATKNILLSVMGQDSTITPKAVNAVMSVLEGATPPELIKEDRILKRKEAAQLLGRTTRTVDLLCKSGVLRRVTMGTRKRSFGILASSLVEAMRCGASGKAVTA